MTLFLDTPLFFGFRRRHAVIASAGLAALMYGSILSNPALAEIPLDAQTKLIALQPAFQAMSERHQNARTYPSLESVDDAPVLQQLWDRQALLGAPPYTGKSIAPALEILKIQNVILRSFRQHAEAGNAAQHGGALNEDITVAAQEMILHTTAVVAQSVQSYIEAAPDGTLANQARADLTRIRIGFTSLHAQMLEAFPLYQFKPSNADRLIVALTETAPQIFPSISQNQRPELERALVLGKGTVHAAAVARLDDMLAAIKSAPCNKVCALQ